MKKFPLGDFEIILLEADTAFEDSDWQQKLPASVLARAQTLKAPNRRLEFLRSRYLLLTEGITLEVNGPGGDPTWPSGIVGSLTHKQGHIAIVLCQENKARGIGIDLEEISRVKPEFEPRICTDVDRQMLAAFDSDSRQELLATIFSAKEALYKCHYPLGKKPFYFHDAQLINIDSLAGLIAFEVCMDTSPFTPKGSVTTGWFIQIDLGGAAHVLSLMSLD